MSFINLEGWWPEVKGDPQQIRSVSRVTDGKEEAIVSVVVALKGHNPLHPLAVAKWARLAAEYEEQSYRRSPDAFGPYSE